MTENVSQIFFQSAVSCVLFSVLPLLNNYVPYLLYLCGCRCVLSVLFLREGIWLFATGFCLSVNSLSPGMLHSRCVMGLL